MFLPLTAAPPTMYATPSLDQFSQTGPCHFLNLPAEIRLQIYSLLVLPQNPNDLLPVYEKHHSSVPDHFDYSQKQPGTDLALTTDLAHPTIRIRTVDPLRYGSRIAAGCFGVRKADDPTHSRSSYSVRCDRFRARTMATTYHCINMPMKGGGAAILGANKQIHAEAAEHLYGSYTFDFDSHVEAIVPFLSDLTPYARSCIRNIRVVKRALAYEKEFDRCEWATALQYVASPESMLSLRKLELGVVAGRPGVNGWDRIATYSATDFRLLKEMEGMEWIRDLLALRGLSELEIKAVIEHCPPATNSMAMASYIRFSASVEGSFASFMKGHLLGISPHL